MATEAWRNIDWDQIDTSYPYGTHADDSGLVKDQLKSALFDEYEKVLQMHHDRVQNNGLEGSIASATTPDIGAEIENILLVTGIVNITGFVTADAGATRELVFADVLTLTDGATLKIFPSGRRDIITAAGDWAKVRSRGSGDWEIIAYQRVDGLPLVGIIQKIPFEYTLEGSTSTTIPWDDSIPENDEGGEFLDISFQAKYPDSTLYFEALFFGATNTGDRIGSICLFKDTEQFAERTAPVFIDNEVWALPFMLKHHVGSGDTASHDWKIRCGMNSGGTLYINRNTTGLEKYDDTWISRLTIEEVRL